MTRMAMPPPFNDASIAPCVTGKPKVPDNMKFFGLILIPTAVAIALTHLAVGWADFGASFTTFSVVFFLIGGIEGIAFFLKSTIDK